ncbi:MAG: hypothetical protein FWD98_07825, partial [Defluviitaleaceae bacterium]|nr:hypothetical protein [Defluviitaleaceae bacterium]
MRLYSALKQGLHIDKLVVFMFVSLLAATLFTYFTSGGGFFVDRLDYFFIGLVRETVELNLDVFTSSPLDSGFLLEEGGRMRAPDVRFSHTYLALSHHPSWLLNSVLIRLMIIGRFNVLMAGIVIAAYVYRTDPLRFGNATAWCLMKWQVLTAVLSVVVLIGVTAVLGTAMGLVMYQQISGHEGMVFVRELYNETDGLWRPDAAYYARALTLT